MGGVASGVAAGVAMSVALSVGEVVDDDYDPSELFVTGKQGAVFDLRDFGTLWQDIDGTQQVTALEQSVAIMLDKRFRCRREANVAPKLSTAATDAGITKVGEVLRFTAAAQGAKADLTPTGTITNGFHEVKFKVSGYTGGSLRLQVFGTGETAIAFPALVSANNEYTALIDLLPGGASNQVIRIEARGAAGNTFDVSDVTVRAVPGNHVWQTSQALRAILSARHNLLLGTAVLATQSVTTRAEAYTLSFKGTGTVTLSGTSTAGPLVGTGANNRVSLTFTPTAGTLTLTVAGSVTEAQLEPGNAFTRYQRVTTATDYDAEGWPRYLLGNGTFGGLTSQEITGASVGFPLSIACAAKADGNVAGAVLGVWGGAPPYYEIQKTTTANQWRAFVRGAVNASNSETVGTNATPHVALATFTASAVDFDMDGTNAAAATAQSNAFGTITEVRVLQGGVGVHSGRFYAGVVYFDLFTAAEWARLNPFLKKQAGLS